MTKAPDALVQAIGGVDDSGDFNGIKGLPESPPDGEEVVWQGEPKWSALAIRLFRVRLVLIYFVLLVGFTVLLSEATPPETLARVVWQIGLAALTTAILVGLAWLYATTTVYTVTNKRLVLEFGVAFTMSLNIPWDLVESAATKKFGDGTADVVISLLPGNPVSYVTLWPFARPWHFLKVQPMIRGVHDPDVLIQAIAGVVDPLAMPRENNEATKDDNVSMSALQTVI